MPSISKKNKNINISSTLEINAKALKMRMKGIDVLRFGVGESDYETPSNIKKCAMWAIEEGFTKYTSVDGMEELKKAIINKFKRDNNIEYDLDNILVSNGAKQALFNCLSAILNPTDEVMFFSPCWVSYVDMVKICGAKSKIISTIKNKFKITAKLIEENLSPNTKAIILSNPVNPTGFLIKEKEIRKICDLAKKHDFYIISDETYEFFVYHNKKIFSPASIKEMQDRVFTVNSVSKTYSMTGWRIGYIAGPKKVMPILKNIQAHTTGHPCTIAQKAAISALKMKISDIQIMFDAFNKRMEYVYKEFSSISKLKINKPEGTFYLFIDVSAYFNKKIKNSADFSNFLLNTAHVAVIPGSAFFSSEDKYIRFSYASSTEDLIEGIKRIKKALLEI